MIYELLIMNQLEVEHVNEEIHRMCKLSIWVICYKESSINLLLKRFLPWMNLNLENFAAVLSMLLTILVFRFREERCLASKSFSLFSFLKAFFYSKVFCS